MSDAEFITLYGLTAKLSYLLADASELDEGPFRDMQMRKAYQEAIRYAIHGD
jgi:hypothetical protein